MPGTIDYNPVLPARLGAGPAAQRPAVLGQPGAPRASTAAFRGPRRRCSSTRRSAKAGTRALTFVAEQALQPQPPIPGLLHAVEGRGHLHRLPVEFHRRRTTASGAIPDDKFGLPLGFDPRIRAGSRHARPAPPLRLVGRLSSCRRTSRWRGSSRRRRAGHSLRWPAPTSTVTATAALSARPGARQSSRRSDERRRETARRPRLRSTWTCASARSSSSADAATVEAILDAFNVFNRVNFIEDTNQSSFAIFGTGAYPANPLPTYGRYTLTLPPRQLQIAAKITF